MCLALANADLLEVLIACFLAADFVQSSLGSYLATLETLLLDNVFWKRNLLLVAPHAASVRYRRAARAALLLDVNLHIDPLPRQLAVVCVGLSV